MVSSEGFQDFLQSSRDLTRSLGNNKDLVKDIAEGEMDINEATKKQQAHRDKAIGFFNKAKDIGKQILANNKKIGDADKKAMGDQIKGLRKRAVESSRQMKAGIDGAKKGNSFWTNAMSKLSNTWNSIGWNKGKKAMTDIGKSAADMGKGLGESFQKTLGMVTGLKFNWTMLLGPIGLAFNLIVEMVKAMFKVNNEVTALGRRFQISKDEARDMRAQMVAISADLNELGVTYENIMTQLVSVNDELATSVNLADAGMGEVLQKMAMLVERTRLSQEAATGFGMAMIASGEPSINLAESAAIGALEAEK